MGYTSLLNNQVPGLWSVVSYPSLKPLASWIKDLHFRVAFLREWLTNGQPKAFPLPVFFFPQGFMTGSLQVHARKYKVAINSLSFSFAFYDEYDVNKISESPENGVIVYGLWMEGARWDAATKQLDESLPGETYSMMVPIHFLPSKNHSPDKKLFACPVYKTSTRA